MSEYTVDHFYVEIPDDCESDPDLRFDIAITQAQEAAICYAMPATWDLLSDDGNVAHITRTRYSTPDFPAEEHHI